MAPKVNALHVFNRDEMEATITRLILAGYSLANRTPDAATMVRRKHLSPAWVLLGILTLTVALWVYLVVYACQRDHLVHIVLEAPVGRPEPPGAAEVADKADTAGVAVRWPVAVVEGEIRPD